MNDNSVREKSGGIGSAKLYVVGERRERTHQPYSACREPESDRTSDPDAEFSGDNIRPRPAGVLVNRQHQIPLLLTFGCSQNNLFQPTINILSTTNTTSTTAKMRFTMFYTLLFLLIITLASASTLSQFVPRYQLLELVQFLIVNRRESPLAPSLIPSLPDLLSTKSNPSPVQLKHRSATPTKHKYVYTPRRIRKRETTSAAQIQPQGSEKGWRKVLAAVACAVFVSVW